MCYIWKWSSNILIRILWRQELAQLTIWNVEYLLVCQLLRFFLWLGWFIGSAGDLHNFITEYSKLFSRKAILNRHSLPCYQFKILNFRRHSGESAELRRGHARLANYKSALNHAWLLRLNLSEIIVVILIKNKVCSCQYSSEFG